MSLERYIRAETLGRAFAHFDANSRARALTEAESRHFAKIICEIDRIAPATMTEINKMFGWGE